MKNKRQSKTTIVGFATTKSHAKHLRHLAKEHSKEQKKLITVSSLIRSAVEKEYWYIDNPKNGENK